MALRLKQLISSVPLIGALAALVGCGVLAALMSSAPREDLAAARARWAGHAVKQYRLLVNEATASGSCSQEVQVANEQITAVSLNECVRIPSWTVSNLFTWAAGLEAYASRCYPSDVTCVCHAIYTTQTRFDPQLGYPQQISYRWHLTLNWAYLGHWSRLWRAHELPSCGAVARRVGDYTTVTVVSLTQLP